MEFGQLAIWPLTLIRVNSDRKLPKPLLPVATTTGFTSLLTLIRVTNWRNSAIVWLLKLFNQHSNLPQQTVNIFNLLWVNCGVFNQSLVMAIVGPLTCANISISCNTASCSYSVLHAVSWKWSLSTGIGLGRSKIRPYVKNDICVTFNTLKALWIKSKYFFGKISAPWWARGRGKTPEGSWCLCRGLLRWWCSAEKQDKRSSKHQAALGTTGDQPVVLVF